MQVLVLAMILFLARVFRNESRHFANYNSARIFLVETEIVKSEEVNEEQQDGKKMKYLIGIGSKAHNIIYNYVCAVLKRETQYFLERTSNLFDPIFFLLKILKPRI